MRYFIDISFRGTAYSGWQVQPNAPTVQAVIDQALSTILRQTVQCVGAGRTDAGVHARQMIAHFDWEGPLPEHFRHQMNGFLPNDIAVHKVLLAQNPDLHARFDALSRSYIYQLVLDKSPELYDFAYWVRRSLDLKKMEEAAASLSTFSDFASFCKAHGANLTTLCTLYEARFDIQSDRICFHIKANRFLRGMVRAIVGTLLDVGTGKQSVQGFKDIIAAKDRKRAGPSAAAKGLFLTKVLYPEGSFKQIQ